MVFVTKGLLVGWMKPKLSRGGLHDVSDVSLKACLSPMAATRKHVTSTEVWLAGGGKCGLPKAELICISDLSVWLGCSSQLHYHPLNSSLPPKAFVVDEAKTPTQLRSSDSMTRLWYSLFRQGITVGSGHSQASMTATDAEWQEKNACRRYLARKGQQMK
jgi:hypothetical protein